MAAPEPVILHRCPNCGRVFDSPSVCVERDGSGTPTVPFPAQATKEAYVDPEAWPYKEELDES